ncbi:MAG: sigma-70 family RNA polymerase sigma factor [Actinomycetota bacterium]|nr:sigma-70 family RNA polymerase sigma factor [Actinomycetota bacterium]
MAPLLAQRPRTDRAFERLYRRHVGDVYRYSLAVLRNPADAEDVTQTTFLNAYRAFQRGERPKTAHNWLIKIAHNVCRQRFRSSARRPQEVEFDEDLAATLAEDEGPSAEDIRRGLGQLAFNQRAALVARELEGRSYAEIAEILGLSVGAVETLIFRARRALREQLEGALTCHEAELAASRQLDGQLPRAEKGALRAHLRQCPACATFARRVRAQRTALKALAAVPIPGTLASFFGGASVGSGMVAVKFGAAAATLLAAGAATSVGTKHAPWQERGTPAAVTPAAAAPASLPAALRVQATATPDARPAGLSAAVRAKPKRVSTASARSQSRVDARPGAKGRGKSESRGRSARAHGQKSNHQSAPSRKAQSSRAFAKKKDGAGKSRGSGGGNGNGGGGNGGGGEKLPDLGLPQLRVELPKLPKP